MNRLALDRVVRRALMEDIGHGDITTELTPNTDRVVTGTFLAKANGVLCGSVVARRCFEMLDPGAKVSFAIEDGALVSSGSVFGRVEAPAICVLTAERVALNFMQRLSGIASLAHRWAKRAEPNGIRVVETRKTTPLMRMLEKYAVLTGAGYNHRMDMDHAVMLKDNHFAVSGMAPGELVRLVKRKVSHTMKVVAEAGDPTMVEPIISAGADVVLLDNFTPEQVKEAVTAIGGRAVIEISGGINETNLDDYLIDGVDVISIGALTHSYKALDISLNVDTG